jgi:hypothetical protein
MVKAELEKDEEIVVLSFNGWLFEGVQPKSSLRHSNIIGMAGIRKR